ncbi:MAG: hypothetical protein HYV42_05040 [Candidatus Magasanikbacteria bacterium]|nr:hypothetical protein [Candidatus Magasanikbacteria bacterium]
MITLPLYIFLFVYLGFLLFFAVFFAINVGHFSHTGTFTLGSFLATFLLLAATAIILWSTWWLLQGVDWQQPLPIWNNAWLGNVFPSQEIFSPFDSLR